MTSTKHLDFAKKACSFLTKSPDPFHVVANSVSTLEGAGFQRLSKREPFKGKIVPGGKYYYTINHSTLVAFTVGKKFNQSTGGCGFKVIGGHTDSPNLKIKPYSKKQGKEYVQLGVECYGGGLWHTWFDRDLGVSGRVLVRSKDDEKKIEQKLVLLDDPPIARVSTLCIHLQTADERKAFAVNKETHTSPIIGTKAVLEEGVEEQINAKSSSDDNAGKKKAGKKWIDGQEPKLIQMIADKLEISVEQIADFELNLFDVQPASIGGIEREFLNSARLDNLATVFCAVEALATYSSDDNLVANDTDISLIALFDHEEVGSSSAVGAGAPVMAEAVRRISSALSSSSSSSSDDSKGDHDTYASCIRNSFVLSVDQAHAIHPNFASKHEPNHAPVMNDGIVIKTNQNQRYATNGVTGFIVRELGRTCNIPIQEFVVKNDCPCGSTIGPIISSNTGIRTVDIGMPQLSMHSCREVMGVVDLTYGYELFKGYFEHFRTIDSNLEG